MAHRLGSKAKATHQTPSLVLNLNSFMLEWEEPLSIST